MKDTHDELRDLFKYILGSDVNIKDNIKSSEKAFFCLIINKLDEAHKNDERLFELSGIDLNKAQNNLPFIFQPDKNDNNPSAFAYCIFDMDSFRQIKYEWIAKTS